MNRHLKDYILKCENFYFDILDNLYIMFSFQNKLSDFDNIIKTAAQG